MDRSDDKLEPVSIGEVEAFGGCQLESQLGNATIFCFFCPKGEGSFWTEENVVVVVVVVYVCFRSN